jgi:hypothetical protein
LTKIEGIILYCNGSAPQQGRFFIDFKNQKKNKTIMKNDSRKRKRKPVRERWRDMDRGKEKLEYLEGSKQRKKERAPKILQIKLDIL